MAMIQPLAQFIPKALADKTVEETIRQAILADRTGTVNSPLGPIRGLNAQKAAIPVGPRYMGVMVPGRYGSGNAELPGMLSALTNQPQPTDAGGRMAAPIQGSPVMPAGSPQPAGNWGLEDMGQLPPGPIYPTVYPAGAQPGDPIGPAQPNVPRETLPAAQPQQMPQQNLPPWSYTPPTSQASPSQGGMSDAGMWGLVAAGLGILANNTGNYGQAGPAIGRGGLIGVNTYLDQRQIAQQMQLRNRLADQQQQLQQAQIGNYQAEAQQRLEAIKTQQILRDAYGSFFEGSSTDEQAKRMSDPATHYAVAGIALKMGNQAAAKQAIDSGIALQKEQAGKWQLDWQPTGDGKERRVRVNVDSGEVQPVGGETRPIFNPNPLVQVSPQLVGERAYSAKQGGNLAEQMDILQKSAIQATKDIGRFDQLGSLLGQIDTGKYKGTTTSLKAAAKSAGIDLEAMGVKDDVAPAQAAIALSQQMALELRNPQTGAGMPGNLSNADRDFLVQMTAGVENDPKAWPILIDAFKQLRRRDQVWAKMARDYAKGHDGQLDYGFIDEVQKYADEHPLFSGKGKAAANAGPSVTKPATGKMPWEY